MASTATSAGTGGEHAAAIVDEWVFGWDPTPGIVSVWADRRGRALVWHRSATGVACTPARFRPWLLAASLGDLDHVGAALVPHAAPGADTAPFAYQRLAGPAAGTYHYLLTARDGRALEDAVLTGAARRLGQPVARLGDLGADYYRVGAVEQYLMSTGRVYFRGLAYGDLHRLQFDLETTALSPQHGRIFLVAVRDTQGLATVLEAPTPDDEPQLIAELCRLIRDRDPDVIENHNLFGFDLPFLFERAAALGVPLELGRPEGPRLLERFSEPAAYRRRRRTRYSLAGRELIDTLDAVWRHDFAVRDMPGYGLKVAARYFGVAAPERTYLPGHAIFRTYQTDPAQVRRYALDDVQEVDGLSQRLLGAPFALAAMAPRRYERVAAAGPAMGILEPMLVRSYLRAATAIPVGPPPGDGADGGHAGGATYLFAAGVAGQVVKADIASMYPSIMRVYGIGPAQDTLGVLLGLVGRLTDLRLHHKQAARVAAPGSAAAFEHSAVQAAMKILINSAYGYMGAGRMALFADRAAADAVTRQGRAILDGVVAALRARGMALIEGDTDGVFFAVPPGWTAAQEAALVAEVAATLPAGLRLEMEGRYRAMLSHEVKNYALLTYDGALIVRGGALRSSRSEPFGARFLEAALSCTLRGDTIGLQQVYQATVAALRARQLPVADVATRARLAKSPGEYGATRGRLREGPYEALLAAGRTAWEAGDQIRYYRAQGGRFVWLPDEPDAPPEESDEGRAVDPSAPPVTERPRDYDVPHYLHVLHTSYVSRLRKAFAPKDFAQLFCADGQLGLFDQPLAEITPVRVRLPTA
ncbi:MAG TPA: DNA polymerase domain-containing protein [Chloroflexia bacterium]|nr:DNA polymerase domain-containing protein [Chloroflexia bacterium]